MRPVKCGANLVPDLSVHHFVDSILWYQSRVPLTKPFLNSKQKKHLDWVRAHFGWTLVEQWKAVFCDESQFCLSFKGCRVWRQLSEIFQSTCPKRSVKFPQFVLVWGCVLAAGVGQLCLMETTVNAAVHQDILDHFLIFYIDDNSKMEILCSSKISLHHIQPNRSSSDSRKRILKSWIGLPCQQPRCQPHQKLIGNYQTELAAEVLSPKNWKSLLQSWQSVTLEECNKLIDSVPRLIAEILAQNLVSFKVKSLVCLIRTITYKINLHVHLVSVD